MNGSADSASAAPGDYTDQLSEAYAETVLSHIVSLDLLNVTEAHAAYPDGELYVQGDVTAEALSTVDLTIPALSLPVLAPDGESGLLTLGSLGAVAATGDVRGNTNEAAAATLGPAANAIAQAGVVGEDGAVNLDPASAGDAEPTRLDVISLLDDLGLAVPAESVIDTAALEIGAVSSRAEILDGELQIGDDPVPGEYMVAGADIVLHSDAIAGLIGTLNTAIQGTGGVADTVGDLLDAGSLLDDLVGGLDLDVLGLEVSTAGGSVTVDGLDDFTDITAAGITGEALPLVDPDSGLELGAVDLTTGEIRIDLEAIHAPNTLSNLPANTPLLDAATLAGITDMVSGAIDAFLDDQIAEIQAALDAVTITASLPITAEAAGIDLVTGSATVTANLGQVIDTEDGADGVTAVTSGLALAPGLADVPGIDTVLGLLGLDLGTLLGDITGSLGPVLETALDGVVTPLVSDLLGAVDDLSLELDVLDPLLAALSPLLTTLQGVVLITINNQPTPYLTGDNAFTVEAVNIEVLNAVGGAPIVDLSLASSSVHALAEDIAPMLDIVQDAVEPGDTIDVSSTDWAPGTDEITVELRDPEGTVVATQTLPADATGAFETTFTIPADAASGVYTVNATDGAYEAEDTVGVFDPSVTADGPTEEGADMPVAGADWPPGGTVELVLIDPDTDDPVPGAQTITVPVGENGAFPDGTTYPIPAGLADGDYTLQATDGTYTRTDTVTVAEVPATLNVVEDEVAPGEDATIESEGWPAGAEVTVELRDAEGNVAAGPETVTADADGAFTTTLTVPADAADGTYTAFATDGDEEASDDVAVVTPVPTVTVDDPVAPGDDAPVAGGDWPANTDVELTLTDPETGEPVGDTITVTTDENGDIPAGTTYPIPDGLADGDYEMVATDGTSTATDTVTVAADAGGDEPTVSVEDPAAPGTDAPVTGGGWPPNTDVELTLTDPETGEPVGDTITVTTDENGDIPSGTTYPIPDGLADGDYEMVATDGTSTATDTVTVAADAGGDGPTVSVEDPAAPGTDAPVTGGGWPPNTDVELTLTDPETGEPVGDTITVTTDENGDIPAGTTYPIPDGLADGDYEMVATDGTSTATDTVTVAEDAGAGGPSISVDDPVAPGEDATVTGEGWPPNTDVEVTLTDPETGEPVGPTVTVTSDVDGTFTVPYPIPADLADGDYDLVATDGTSTATDTVTVSASGIWMELEYDTRVYGENQQQIAYGHGFQPGESVRGTMYSTPHDLGVQIADADGDVTFTWTIDSDHQVAVHRVELVGAESGSVDATFRIVAGSGLAATGVDLGPLIPIALLILVAGAALMISKRRNGVSTPEA
ncbi:choice-of-anchor G family protein [Microbacterium rhizophilus]|uniref:choice-of-anchor G family protein n=1 Tax=Microbacterium rhizophilus TaxID=3138934 RepID=UPI0031EEBAD1